MPIHHLSGKIISAGVVFQFLFYLLPGTYQRLLAQDEQTRWRLFTPTPTWALRAVERTFRVRLPQKLGNNSDSSGPNGSWVQMLNFQWQNKPKTLPGTFLTRLHGRDSSFPFVQQIYNQISRPAPIGLHAVLKVCICFNQLYAFQSKQSALQCIE